MLKYRSTALPLCVRLVWNNYRNKGDNYNRRNAYTPVYALRHRDGDAAREFRNTTYAVCRKLKRFSLNNVKNLYDEPVLHIYEYIAGTYMVGKFQNEVSI